MTARSLRRRLFRSHLVVLFVAVGVMVATMVVGIALIAAVTGDGITLGRRGPLRRGDQETLGVLLLLGMFVASIAAASLVGWRMARRLAAPLESLGEATRRIAQGDYDVSVPDAGVDEIDRLGGDVRSLALALDETEARRLRLIGDIAHELRTPLSTIEGSMEALMDGVVPADDATFAGIAREAARLRRLANDLSALSSSAELSPLSDASPIDLASITRSVVDLLHAQAEAKGLELTYLSQGDTQVLGDHDRLTQVVTNIVGNAIQYTGEGHVAVEVDGSWPGVEHEVVLTVTDSGRGLTDEDTELVFERFHRVDEHFTDGSGVGLTIARQIVWAHRGTIAASSRGLGHGATFAVALPRA